MYKTKYPYKTQSLDEALIQINYLTKSLVQLPLLKFTTNYSYINKKKRYIIIVIIIQGLSSCVRRHDHITQNVCAGMFNTQTLHKSTHTFCVFRPFALGKLRSRRHFPSRAALVSRHHLSFCHQKEILKM